MVFPFLSKRILIKSAFLFEDRVFLSPSSILWWITLILKRNLVFSSNIRTTLSNTRFFKSCWWFCRLDRSYSSVAASPSTWPKRVTSVAYTEYVIPKRDISVEWFIVPRGLLFILFFLIVVDTVFREPSISFLSTNVMCWTKKRLHSDWKRKQLAPEIRYLHTLENLLVKNGTTFSFFIFEDFHYKKNEFVGSQNKNSQAKQGLVSKTIRKQDIDLAIISMPYRNSDYGVWVRHQTDKQRYEPKENRPFRKQWSTQNRDSLEQN